MSETSVVSEKEISLSDILVFLAVSNIHYPLFEVLGVEFSPGLLPLPAALIMTAAIMRGKLSTFFSVFPYVIVGVLYFSTLAFMGIGYAPIGAYVTMMQTATALAFLQYLFSRGPLGARDTVLNIQKLLGVYIVLFTLFVFRIRATSDVNLFNQVAQSNYFGLLTTYFILSVLRRRWISGRTKRLVGVSLLVNTLGAQRASLVINLFVVASKYIFAKKGLLTLFVLGLAITYALYSNQINSSFAQFMASLRNYYALALLELRDLEFIIRQSIISDEGYDASGLVRVFSLWYVGGEVLANPMSPIAANEYGYLSNSHNVFLEYFKVGGFLFAVLSFVALFRRCRTLIRRGYCDLNPWGFVIALGYTMLFNDLFIGFFLLSLSFETGWETAAAPAVKVGPLPLGTAGRPAPAAALS